MSKGKVVVIGSNANRIETQGGYWGDTGNYLNETVVPMLALIDAGYDVVLATPNGARPTMDKASDSPAHFGGDVHAYEHAKLFWIDAPAMQARTLRSILDEGIESYYGVFIPGGQAPIVDLMQEQELGEILRHFHAHQKPTAMLCHGPISATAAMPYAREFRAALIAGDHAKAKEWSRGWQYAGYRMTVFQKSEEKVIEDTILHAKIYFDMPYALGLAGAVVDTGPDFEPYVIEDRELITGQNPRSDHPIAEALIAALDRKLGHA
ncbi:type 1 glutamine amidotransferase domain-containing protein [Sphingomonas sp. TDK1]|uniref:type 1 glutamine amidotransferase domain-containing protein n=1 Tax=Sphingomonas sp. TDK1 TaxID=453247 RepID=UPI0007DA1CCD|nr:type 1 glutamine amidotransferase domain-containing protein [Sphingomonas sp. TDK1]OAN63917.1 glutamine amidotransferase [Sphingomonas sp. TDK1]